jgi:hypothetical protein
MISRQRQQHLPSNLSDFQQGIVGEQQRGETSKFKCSYCDKPGIPKTNVLNLLDILQVGKAKQRLQILRD